MEFGNILGRALPSAETYIQDSLDLQINVEDPLNQAMREIDVNQMQHQIDAYTTMMKDASEPKISESDKVKRRPTPYQRTPEAQQSNGGNWEKRFHLHDERYLTVNRFDSTYRVHIREFFTDKDGVLRPTKRGVCLKLEEWRKLQQLMKDVDESLVDVQ